MDLLYLSKQLNPNKMITSKNRNVRYAMADMFSAGIALQLDQHGQWSGLSKKRKISLAIFESSPFDCIVTIEDHDKCWTYKFHDAHDLMEWTMTGCKPFSEEFFKG